MFDFLSFFVHTLAGILLEQGCRKIGLEGHRTGLPRFYSLLGNTGPFVRAVEGALWKALLCALNVLSLWYAADLDQPPFRWNLPLRRDPFPTEVHSGLSACSFKALSCLQKKFLNCRKVNYKGS